MENGIIQVYTGDGKGKTTAALGQAFRASGWGLQVGFYQFLKGPATGEAQMAQKLGWDFRQFATGRWFVDHAPDDEERALAKEGLRVAGDATQSKDLVVLDEISHALNLNLIAIDTFLTFLEEKPPGTELILTGRNMPEFVLERAALVTKMQLIKHPYDHGLKARQGREY